MKEMHYRQPHVKSLVHMRAVAIAATILILYNIQKMEAVEQTISANIPIIQSELCQKAITIDGIDEEWKANRTFVINNKTAVGVCRNENFLYVHFITSDPELSMQIMNFGFMLWFDPQGSQNKVVGVQFPVINLQPPPPRDGKPPTGDDLTKFLKKREKDIGIMYNTDKNVKIMTMEMANKEGIDVKIGVDEGLICYELKYPIRKPTNKTTANGLEIKKNISICLETPEIDFQKMMLKFGEKQKPPQNGNAEGPKNKEIRPEPPKVKEKAVGPDQRMRPKPPELTRISQWIKVLFE